MMMMMTTFENS